MSDRIRGFDGLRALAVLLVFHQHAVGGHAAGHFGVWMFFVLSGFLITTILADQRQAVEDGVSTRFEAMKQFYWRRTLRIFPVYYGMLALIGLASTIRPIPDFSGGEWIAYWSYTTNILMILRDATVGDFGHLWSVAVEEQYYVLFAPLIIFAPRRHTAAICAAVVAGGLAFKLYMHLVHAPGLASYINSLTNFYMMGLGGLAGLAARQAGPWVGRPAIQFGCLGLFLAAPLVGAYLGVSVNSWGQMLAPLVALGLISIKLGQSTLLVRGLDIAPLRWIGRVSYGFYLLHNFVPRAPFQAGLDQLGLGWVSGGAVLLQLLSTLALASMSWLLFEKPILTRFSRGAPRLEPAPAGTLASA